MSNYGLNLYEEEIKSHIDFLNEQIQKCSFSHDWTLLFSDSRIMDVWLALVSAMEKMATQHSSPRVRVSKMRR